MTMTPMKSTGLWLSVFAILTAGSAEIHAGDMTQSEIRGMDYSSRWQNTTGVVGRGADGKVLFLFGETQPSVVCAPLQVCDIELQAEETVKDVLVGDTVRWSVEAASSGDGRDQRIHLIVRPSEPGLLTSMIVTTSRRTYHIQLRSHASRYMARVGFSYPTPAIADMKAVNARLTREGRAEGAEGINFSYSISGQARWRPKRVYSDGAKTYIQFPSAVKGQEMPVLFLVSGGEKQIVNYRIHKDMMIVDYDIDRAWLVAGTGWHQKKITISRRG